MTQPKVLITGAASGIGRATALYFAQNNWQCILVDCDEQRLSSLAKVMPRLAEGDHRFECLNLTSNEEVIDLAKGVNAVDALINNAGMTDQLNLPLVSQTDADLEPLLKLNYLAPADLIKALNPCFKPGARIVNVASGAGLRAIPWRGAYSASKSGLIAQSQALAKERADLCVTVLCPGFVRTELVDTLIASGRLNANSAVAKIPLGRMSSPDEMAVALYFLASQEASPLSGQVISVDGGSSVFGGSQPYSPIEMLPMPLTTSLNLSVEGDHLGDWLPNQNSSSSSDYLACLDLSLMSLESTNGLNQLHQIATKFYKKFKTQASLTVLLPSRLNLPWYKAGDGAALRMLIAILACEWGPQALRINGLEVSPTLSANKVSPIVHFLAGAGAQYITGQTLVLH